MGLPVMGWVLGSAKLRMQTDRSVVEGVISIPRVSSEKENAEFNAMFAPIVIGNLQRRKEEGR